MDHIGIDIGAFSTFVCSSKEKGTMLEDEMNKKSIRTVLDLLHPRIFGNHIRVDNRRSIKARQRGFTRAENEDDYKHLFMFLGYLKRLFALKSVTFGVPYWYNDTQKRRLADLVAMHGIHVENILYDLSAASLCFIKHDSIPQSFLILDFGYSKTTAALFSFKDNMLKTEKIAGIKVGSYNMDQKLIEYALRETNTENNTYWRELIANKLDSLKIMLNSTDSAIVSVSDDVTFSIDKATFEDVVKDEVEQIRKFIDDHTNGCDEGSVIEIVGGNSNSYLIRSLFPKNVRRSLNPVECVASGCSLMPLVERSKITFRDVSSTYLVKVKGSSVKPSLLFASSEVPCSSIKVTYKKKEDFCLEVYENDCVIGEVDVSIKSDELAVVSLAFGINKRGMLEISDAGEKSGQENAGSYEITLRMTSFSDEQLSDIKKCEDELREKEAEIEQIKDSRTSFETLLTTLNQNLKRFGDEFGEQRELIDAVSDDFLSHPSSASLKDEKDVHAQFLKRLEPVTTKLKALNTKVKQDVGLLKDRIRGVTTKYHTLYTPGLYQLRGELFMIEKWESNFKLNIDTITSCDLGTIEVLRKKIDALIARAVSEASEKIRAEEAEKAKQAVQEEEPAEKQEADDNEPENAAE